MVQSNKIPVDWSLKDLDNDRLFRPQFPIGEGGVQVSVGSTLVDQSRYGFQTQITQWTSGKPLTFSFKTTFFARNKDEDIAFLMQSLLKMGRKDEKLGRAPICHFTYGQTISSPVLVETMDTTIKRVQKNGNPLEAEVSIVLKRYTPFSQQQLDPTKPAKESFFLVATQAEKSYEAIAKRFYGDPLLGDRLRKRHPESPFAPEIGQTVHVPSSGVLLQEEVAPSSHVFNFNDVDAMANLELLLDRRNQKKVVVVR